MCGIYGVRNKFLKDWGVRPCCRAASALPVLRGAIAGLAAVLSVALSGCAPLPAPGPEFQPRSAADFASAQAFAATPGNWPASAWWKSYGDTQLDALIDEALAGSPDLAVAQARVARARAMAEVAGAPLWPQLNATASGGTQRNSYNYLTPDVAVLPGWNAYGQAALNTTWEIDFWGKNRAALAAATSELQAREAEQAQARLVLTTALVATYADLARLFALQDIQEHAIQIRRTTSKLFAERFAFGLETRGGVMESEAKLAQSETDLLVLQEQIALQRNRIAAIVGAGPDRGLSVARPTVRVDKGLALPARLGAELLGRRPDVAAARLQAEATASRIDQKQAEFYPSINLIALIGVQSIGLSTIATGGSTYGTVGPALNLPIFTGGRLQGELRGARAAHDEAVANYNRTLTQAFQEAADAATSLRALGAQQRKAQDAVTAAREAFKVATQRYAGGLATYLDVLVAEDILLASTRILTELQARDFGLNVALIRALGGGFRADADALSDKAGA